MRNLFLGLFIFLALSSCQNVDNIEKPKTLLSKSQMKDLVYDMVLLDAALGVNERRLEDLNIEMFEFLSKKYGLDSTDLQQNILYYNMKFDENNQIYEKVKDSIERLDKVYDSISKVRDSVEKLEKKRLDSINKLDTVPEKIKAKRSK